MFNSLEEAIGFGEGKQDKDGGRPQFYLQAVEYKDAEGNVQSRNEIYVRIFNISDPKNVIERQKREEDEKRWPEHWQAYKNETEVPSDGTPVESFPQMTPADIANCKRRHIRTVEEILDLADNALMDIFGSKGRATVKAAKAFLEYRGDVPALLKRIEELEKQLGNTTDDSEQHPDGDGVRVSADSGGKRKPGRKKATRSRKKVSKGAGKRVSVDDTD